MKSLILIRPEVPSLPFESEDGSPKVDGDATIVRMKPGELPSLTIDRIAGAAILGAGVYVLGRVGTVKTDKGVQPNQPTVGA